MYFRLVYCYLHPRCCGFARRYSQVCNTAPNSVAHIPVMRNEVIDCFQPKENQLYIDMTFGAGGHTEQLLNSAPNLRVFALDRDPIAFEMAKNLSTKYPGQLVPLLGKFSELPNLLKLHGIQQNMVDGILFDLGCSSMQFDTAERGFSISKDGPLDMRMDGKRFPSSPTAADVLAQIDEPDLVKILKIYGEEKQAKKIARAVIESRYQFVRLRTTNDLSNLVSSVCKEEHRLDKLQRPSHTATKTFQALRIFVNNEINELNYSLILAHRYLKVGGRIVTLSFHSLEDRVVKRHLSGNVIENAINPLPLKYTDHSLWYNRNDVDSLLHSNWKLLHKHVLVPGAEEVENNPRSRSAKLRCAVKIS